VLQASAQDADGAAQKALATFSEAYWPPLYTFVRRHGYSPTDAQDVVQGFFVHVFEQNTLSRADQEKGRLRTFLLGAMQKFLLKERERLSAIKRGGNQQLVSFDLHLPETEAAMQATAHLDQVSSYDLTWALTIVKRSWKRLQETMATEGKAHWLEELEPFIAGVEAAPPNQGEVAARLGIPVATLRTYLSRLRQRYRELLRAEVANTVSDPADVNGELRYLHHILMT